MRCLLCSSNLSVLRNVSNLALLAKHKMERINIVQSLCRKINVFYYLSTEEVKSAQSQLEAMLEQNIFWKFENIFKTCNKMLGFTSSRFLCKLTIYESMNETSDY